MYAMPLEGGRAFFQETCLVAKDAVPFDVLRRRLETRLESLGVRVKAVLDEEWSYIPVGGPLPNADNETLAFGATANMIHPASGYSVARSSERCFHPLVKAEMRATRSRSRPLCGTR